MLSPLYLGAQVAGFALLFTGVASAVKTTRTLRLWPQLFAALADGNKRWSDLVDFLYPWHQLSLPMKRSKWSPMESMKVRWQLHRIKPWCIGWTGLSGLCATLIALAPTGCDADSVAFGSFLVWVHTCGLWLAYSKRVA